MIKQRGKGGSLLFVRLSRSIRRMSDAKMFALLFASVFALSFTLSSAGVRVFGATISEQAILSHFSPDASLSLVRFITRSFYDDAIEMLYLFVLGFTFFGKPGVLALSALRGAAFGFSFSSMMSVPSFLSQNITLGEFLLYPFSSVTTNACFIVFAAESWVFNSRFRAFSQSKLRIIRSPIFRHYILDFICFTGIIVLLKSVYACLIFFI